MLFDTERGGLRGRTGDKRALKYAGCQITTAVIPASGNRLFTYMDAFSIGRLRAGTAGYRRGAGVCGESMN